MEIVESQGAGMTVGRMPVGAVCSTVASGHRYLKTNERDPNRMVQLVDIQTGAIVHIDENVRAIERHGVWCENCVDCPKAKEVM